MSIQRSIRTRTAVFDPDGRTFIMVRQKHGLRVLLCPGGGVDPGEDMLNGARRELIEEVSGVSLRSWYWRTGMNPRTGHEITAFEKPYLGLQNVRMIHNLTNWYVVRCDKPQDVRILEPEKFRMSAWVYPKDLLTFALEQDAEIGYELQQLNAGYACLQMHEAGHCY